MGKNQRGKIAAQLAIDLFKRPSGKLQLDHRPHLRERNRVGNRHRIPQIDVPRATDVVRLVHRPDGVVHTMPPVQLYLDLAIRGRAPKLVAVSIYWRLLSRANCVLRRLLRTSPPACAFLYLLLRHYIETRTKRTHDVDIFNVIQKVQATVIHLEVDEEQWKITEGSKRQAKWVWSSRTMSGLLLYDAHCKGYR